MISVSFSWGFSPPLFWWKVLRVVGSDGSDVISIQGKDEEALSEEALAPAASAQLPLGTKS